MSPETIQTGRSAWWVPRILMSLLLTAAAALAMQSNAAADTTSTPTEAVQVATEATPSDADDGFVQASEVEASAYNCDPGYVCFYTEANGQGAYCYTNYSNREWSNSNCDEHVFKSYYNNGYSGPDVADHVISYASKGYSNSNGCYHYGPDEGQGNMTGKHIRSVQWFNGEC